MREKSRVAKMRMLRWMCGHTRKDRIRNDIIREKIGVAPIEEKIAENHLRWFGYVQRRPQEVSVRRVDNMIFSWKKGEEGDRRGHWRKSSRETLDSIISLKLWFLTMPNGIM